MKAKTINVLWGILLILAGGLFLAQNLGFFADLAPSVWALIFAGISLLFFISYFINGLNQWGWLFPAFISAGIALTIFLAESGASGGIVAAPVLIGVALPFLGLVLVDRRSNWWALIPAWTLLVIGAIVLLADLVAGEFIAFLVLFGVALPFLFVFLLDRSRRWALIPLYVLTAVGLIPILSLIGSGEAIGATVMFLIALPFFVVYLWSKENWWALLPAGITGTIGVVVLLAGLPTAGMDKTALMNGVMFLGIAATFGVLWLRRSSQPTGWAVYPAAVLALMGVLALALGTRSDLLWPLAIILAGLLLLLNSLRSKKAT
jgi:hypothetical protein